MNELKEMCVPLIEYLKSNHNPYIEISITMDAITLKQSVVGIPVKNKSDQSED